MTTDIEHCDRRVLDKLCGGEGQITMIDIASKNDMYDKARLYAKVVVEPGCSIGYHVHHGESEIYFIQKGKALYNDNGTECVLEPGAVTKTGDGEGHSIACKGSETLEFIALIPMM
jgi:mannose-6-phosphate isomerase-like protein (cupin superfamily)